eukprot:jgi/Chrzof1/13080/Cz07g19030.t1
MSWSIEFTGCVGVQSPSVCILLHWVWRPTCLLCNPYLASDSTDYTVTNTYSQLADLLSTHADGIKHFPQHLNRIILLKSAQYHTDNCICIMCSNIPVHTINMQSHRPYYNMLTKSVSSLMHGFMLFTAIKP